MYKRGERAWTLELDWGAHIGSATISVSKRLGFFISKLGGNTYFEEKIQGDTLPEMLWTVISEWRVDSCFLPDTHQLSSCVYMSSSVTGKLCCVIESLYNRFIVLWVFGMILFDRSINSTGRNMKDVFHVSGPPAKPLYHKHLINIYWIEFRHRGSRAR